MNAHFVKFPLSPTIRPFTIMACAIIVLGIIRFLTSSAMVYGLLPVFLVKVLHTHGLRRHDRGNRRSPLKPRASGSLPGQGSNAARAAPKSQHITPLIIRCFFVICRCNF